jgi:hypothetical protein
MGRSLVSTLPVRVFHALGARGRALPVAVCSGAAMASPNPCVLFESNRTGGGVLITVLTTRGGTWDFAVRRPDAAIKPRGALSYVGNRIYNSSAYHQTCQVAVRRHATTTFAIAVHNRGTLPATITVNAAGSTSRFRVSYLAGLTGTNGISAAVESGRYVLKRVPAGATRYIRIRVTPRGTARVGSTFGRTVTARSTQSTVAVDAVRARLKVSAG